MDNENRFDISYISNTFNGKKIYVFVNHKTAVLCWAKISKIKRKVDVISLDSHPDFANGSIFTDRGKMQYEVFGSKFLPHLPHFSKSEKFCMWDPSNDNQNKQIIEREHRYLTVLNDNFIDVAFMKDIIGNCYWYYLNKKGGNSKIVKCDDLDGKIHQFFPNHINQFEIPEGNFILDIDLDFFVFDDDDFKTHLISENNFSEYMKLILKLSESDSCVGITIALEPACCGGIQNCLAICEKCEKMGLPLLGLGRKVLEKTRKATDI